MKTNLHNIWQKCTWQNLQQNHMQQILDLFVQCRYFKFQMRFNLIFFQFNNGTIETSRFRQLLWSQYELLLSSLASHYLYDRDRSLLMSRRNIIFTFFPYVFSSLGTSRACAALPGSRRCFHVNTGFTFSDDDRILAVTSNICCNIATGTCLI